MSTMPILTIGSGPRASAMGEAFGALSDDASAVFWNPAGLGLVPRPEFQLSHQEWFLGFRDEYGSIVFPTGPGRLGIGLVYSGASGIESWNSQNYPGETLSAHTGIASVAYGQRIGDIYSVGGTLRFLYDRQGEETGLGGALNVGFLAQPWDYLSLGLVAEHVGPGMRYSTSSYALPTDFRLGAAYRQPDWNVAADFVLPISDNVHVHLGGEYTVRNVLTVRAGYRVGPVDLSTLGLVSGVSAGLGLKLGNLVLDYAFAPYGVLGLTHRLGLGVALVPIAAGQLVVQVVDARNRQPLTAEVTVSGAKQATLVADYQGKAVLRGLPEGWLYVTASFPGYSAAFDSVHLSHGRETPPLTLALRKTGTGAVWGRILDAENKTELTGRVVWRGPSNGSVVIEPGAVSYTLRDLAPGDYILTAFGPSEDYLSKTCTVKVTANSVLTQDFELEKKKQ